MVEDFTKDVADAGRESEEDLLSSQGEEVPLSQMEELAPSTESKPYSLPKALRTIEPVDLVSVYTYVKP